MTKSERIVWMGHIQQGTSSLLNAMMCLTIGTCMLLAVDLADESRHLKAPDRTANYDDPDAYRY